MEILNIGPLELIVILVVMFVLLGPKEMVITAYRIGKFIRGIVRSPMWKEIMGYSEEFRELPKKLMEETQLEETLADVKKSTQEATDEIKAQLKEAAEAARVPEAEHIRLEDGATAAGTSSGFVSAESLSAASAGSVAALENAQPAAEISQPAASSISEPAPEPVSQFVPPAAPSTSAPQPVVEIFDAPVIETPAVAPAVAAAAAPALRPRRMREPAANGSQAAASVIEAASSEGPSSEFASFAPRAARRASAAGLAVIAATGTNGSQQNHNGSNGHNNNEALPSSTPSESTSPERISSAAEEAES